MGRWEEIDQPVLRAVFELKQEALAAGSGLMTTVDERDIAARAGITGGLLADSLSKLNSEGFLEGVEVGFGTVLPQGVTGAGLRALGEWPSQDSIAETLPDLLRILADRAVEESTRELLLRAAEVSRELPAHIVSVAMGEAIRLHR